MIGNYHVLIPKKKNLTPFFMKMKRVFFYIVKPDCQIQNMEILNIPQLKIPCVRHKGINDVEKSFDKIITWGMQKDLMQNPETKLTRVYHDSFTNTHANQIRMSIGLQTQQHFKQDTFISSIILKEHTAIIHRFEIDINEFQDSWTSMYQWMREHNYTPSNTSPYEVYQNDYRKHPNNKCIVDLHIPIL